MRGDTDRPCAQLYAISDCARHIRSRHGRTMGRRRRACHGKSAHPAPWNPFRAAAARICHRVSTCSYRILLHLRALVLETAVFHWKLARDQRSIVRCASSEGALRLNQVEKSQLDVTWTHARPALETVCLLYRLYDGNAHELARNPGHVSHVPSAAMGNSRTNA